MHHDTYDDYWKARNLAPHMKNIHCAVLTVGGWFDAEDLQGPFSTFHAIDKSIPESSTRWWSAPGFTGGGTGYEGSTFGAGGICFKHRGVLPENYPVSVFRDSIYERQRATRNFPKAYVFETGTNVWRAIRTVEAWQ